VSHRLDSIEQWWEYIDQYDPIAEDYPNTVDYPQDRSGGNLPATCNHQFVFIFNGPKGYCKKCNRDGRINEKGDIVWV